MDLQKENTKKEFWVWAKTENPRLVENAELGDVYAIQNLDHMFMGFAAAKAQAIPDGFVLNKPAKVGNGTFGIGVKWSTVIGAAQRQFEYTQNDVGEKANIQNLKGILFDVPEGFVLMPKEPTQELLNKMQDFFIGAFENGLTGGQSIHCAYIAMIEAQEPANESE